MNSEGLLLCIIEEPFLGRLNKFRVQLDANRVDRVDIIGFLDWIFPHIVDTMDSVNSKIQDGLLPP